MYPGDYLEISRAAAGVTPDDLRVLLILLKLPRLAETLPARLQMFELDVARPAPEELMALRIAFAFDPTVYRRLCAEADDALAAPLPAERTAHHG